MKVFYPLVPKSLLKSLERPIAPSIIVFLAQKNFCSEVGNRFLEKNRLIGDGALHWRKVANALWLRGLKKGYKCKCTLANWFWMFQVNIPSQSFKILKRIKLSTLKKFQSRPPPLTVFHFSVNCPETCFGMTTTKGWIQPQFWFCLPHKACHYPSLGLSSPSSNYCLVGIFQVQCDLHE